jgi:hypothetical protein
LLGVSEGIGISEGIDIKGFFFFKKKENICGKKIKPGSFWDYSPETSVF